MLLLSQKECVSALLKVEQPNLITLVCGCHLITLSVKKDTTQLSVKVDEL